MFTAMRTSHARSGDSNLPDDLPEHLREKLAATRFGDVRWVAETGSTNSDVLTLARDGAAEGVVLVADRQREGRGRRGRSWVAPAGSSLLVSVLLRPPAKIAAATTIALGVAMAAAIEEVAGVAPGLKWPNDLVIRRGGTQQEERKLAGILAETDWPAGATIAGGWREPAAHERATVVAGVGVNVNWPTDPSVLPEDVLDIGVALNQVVGHVVDRGELLVTFLSRLEHQYGTMVREGSAAAALAEWRERSATLGRRVRVDLGVDDVEGTAVDVTDAGHLVVDTLEGERRTFAVGDIVHLRARA
jgi:BirA family biotin operon repressor/biotin-[acetyl-CoA-carboxylase] ligase